MSHIFGLEHSLTGIADQAFDFLNPFNRSVAVTPTTPTNPIIFPFNTNGAPTGIRPTAAPNNCGPICGPKIKRYITTVCPDGTTTIREQKTRKRRRRLASVSDIKDLASLKQVLGGGKAFDTWIATRSR